MKNIMEMYGDTEVEAEEETEAAVAEEIVIPEDTVIPEEAVIPEENQNKDAYYDPEFDDDDTKPAKSNPLFKKLKIFWGSAVTKLEEFSDKADDLIDDIAR